MLTAMVPSSSSTTMCPAAHAMRSSAFFGGQLQRQLFLATGRAAPPTVRLAFPAVEAKVATGRENRIARHQRTRKKVEGTPDRPRMCVFRSNKHLYVQVIDDSKMHTLASASTMQKPVSEEFDYSCGPTIEIARKVGEVIAKSCLEKGVTRVVFDRGGYPYHGRIEALAAAARENGLEF